MPIKSNKNVKRRKPNSSASAASPRSRGRRSSRGRIGGTKFISIVETDITLKTKHNKQEIYPIPVSELISRINIGSDGDYFATGYNIRFTAATGNDISTVEFNIGHSGDWVSIGTPPQDTFNQQFTDKRPKGKTVVFNKRRLSQTERDFISPDFSNNFLNLRVRDRAGIMSGVLLTIRCVFNIVRKKPESEFKGADDPATDRYDDQDVDNGTTAGNPVVPSVPVQQDIPYHLLIGGAKFNTISKSSPYTYISINSHYNYRVTVAGKVNIVGTFSSTSSSNLQTEYTAAGFEGNIVKV